MQTTATIALSRRRPKRQSQWGLGLTATAIGFFLVVFLIVPVASVVYTAFINNATGGFSLINFKDFFTSSLLLESFFNSLYVAVMSVIAASIIAVPLAYFTTRFNFSGSLIIQVLGFLPLIMPPFVGAIALQLLFGEFGSFNLLLSQYFGFTLNIMDGLTGVIFVESIHYFPFILLNLSASLQNIDRSMEEAAQSLGATGLRLFRRIVFPLSMPGYVAGASLVFLKVFEDLGTPLLLNVNNMLAPQAYLRITNIGLADPMGYVIAVILVVFALLALGVSFLATRGRDYSTAQRGGGGLAKRDLRTAEKVGCYVVVLFILSLVLAPHLALLLLSFGKIWSFSVLPSGFTLNHFWQVFANSNQFIANTILYSGLAALADIILGTAIAYIGWRTRLPLRKLLDFGAMAALAVSGVVLGIGYLRTFHQFTVPGVGVPLANFWIMIVIALTIRRLPYAVRACVAALQQISESLEEAATNLGARKTRTIRRIVLPLMASGLMAGFVTCFATAAVEFSATIMLVSSNADAPLSYGIYILMQSASGRGAGAALGIVSVIIVALATLISHSVVKRYRQDQAAH